MIKVTKEELIAHSAPSPSRMIRTVLNPNSNFDSIPSHILEDARQRGTWVHESIENMLLGEDYVSKWEWQSYMDAFEAFYKDHPMLAEEVELPVVKKDLTAKGIIDFYGTLEGRPAIVDFKTSASVDNKSWGLQLMVYNYIMGGDVDRDLRIVKLNRDGTYNLLYYYYDESLVKSLITMYHYIVQ